MHDPAQLRALQPRAAGVVRRSAARGGPMRSEVGRLAYRRLLEPHRGRGGKMRKWRGYNPQVPNTDTSTNSATAAGFKSLRHSVEKCQVL